MRIANMVRAEIIRSMLIRFIVIGLVSLLVGLAYVSIGVPCIAFAEQEQFSFTSLSSSTFRLQSESGKYFYNKNFVIYLENNKVGIVKYTGTEEKIKIPSSVTIAGKSCPMVEIFSSAFAGAAVKSVVIPSSVTIISQNAFSKCKSLTKVTGCKGLKYIAAKAFYNCSKLASFPFGKKLMLVEAKAFSKSKVKTSKFPHYLAHDGSGNYYPRNSITRVKGQDSYTDAYQVLSLVNKERKKKGLKSLVMDKDLLKAAMQRASEITVLFSHTRPNGTSCFTVCWPKMTGENIAAGQWSASEVMKDWMNSPGHRANILTKSYKSIGVGCFKKNGGYYWVQAFGNSKAKKTSKPKNKTVTHIVISGSKK